MPELNEKLIACVLEHIEAHPEEYEQNLWASIVDNQQDGEYCGTRGCFAGWAVMLSTSVEKWKGLPHNDAIDYSSGDGWYHAKAQQLLGLTRSEASYLFKGAHAGSPQRNAQVIKGRLRDIRTGRGLPPDGPVAAKDDHVG